METGQEIAAITLYKTDEGKILKQMDVHLLTYRATVKDILAELDKVGIEVDGSVLERKSAGLSVMHDAMAGQLVLEYIRVKRHLSTAQATVDACTAQPP
jgi:hypothetical protein